MPHLLLAAVLALAPGADLAASCDAPGQPVDVEAYVPIGGIDQWVTIHGEDCSSPVVLVIHGGPGNPLSPYADVLFGGWTREFTLVQWDQRGAGRTFGRNPEVAEAPLSMARMTADGVEVAEHVSRALGQSRVILLGGSWGSALAVHMAMSRPELFHAYVGVGQLVRQQDNLAASHSRLTELATAADDDQALAVLQALGPPPWTDPRSFGQLRRVTRRYEARATTPAPDGWWQRAPAYATPAELAAAEGGEDHAYLQFVGLEGDGLFRALDLTALGTRLAMPVFLIQGEEDLVTTPDIARRWFVTIEAPRKEFILLPATGHDPNAAMLAAEYRVLREIRATLAD